jgi:hypothetical protein
VWVDKVEVFEHEENSAIFTPLYDVLCSPQEPKQDEVASLASEPITETAPAINTNAAPVGNHVSQGMGNPFAGTSWG